ncbi:hypothetical protein P280DRAFT_474621 [Massarina eburnea CBS 473.64]|uniref:Peptidase A1 domain-containing protein n=1 Tax=Massarina eburnea CBS 473.64 TaxID=1395130 RepID=A0A6A6RK73_9PLEO|nr:hypothetical protein P280DRAFT_474621 [Massarina eburnea CBS 473.64]
MHTSTFTIFSSILLTATAKILAHSNPSSNDISRYTSTIHLNFTKKFSSASTPSINGSIFSRPLTFPIDTGSTGVLLSASRVPEISKNEGTSGTEFLDSSSHLYYVIVRETMGRSGLAQTRADFLI